MLYQNNSPEFDSNPIKGFCIGNEAQWEQSVIEADGDSEHYKLSPVQGDNNSSTSCIGANFYGSSGRIYINPACKMCAWR